MLIQQSQPLKGWLFLILENLLPIVIFIFLLTQIFVNLQKQQSWNQTV